MYQGGTSSTPYRMSSPERVSFSLDRSFTSSPSSLPSSRLEIFKYVEGGCSEIVHMYRAATLDQGNSLSLGEVSKRKGVMYIVCDDYFGNYISVNKSVDENI